MTAAVVHESLSQAHQCRLLAEVLTITKQMLSCAENPVKSGKGAGYGPGIGIHAEP